MRKFIFIKYRRRSLVLWSMKVSTFIFRNLWRTRSIFYVMCHSCFKDFLKIYFQKLVLMTSFSFLWHRVAYSIFKLIWNWKQDISEMLMKKMFPSIAKQLSFENFLRKIHLLQGASAKFQGHAKPEQIIHQILPYWWISSLYFN